MNTPQRINHGPEELDSLKETTHNWLMLLECLVLDAEAKFRSDSDIARGTCAYTAFKTVAGELDGCIHKLSAQGLRNAIQSTTGYDFSLSSLSIFNKVECPLYIGSTMLLCNRRSLPATGNDYSKRGIIENG